MTIFAENIPFSSGAIMEISREGHILTTKAGVARESNGIEISECGNLMDIQWIFVDFNLFCIVFPATCLGLGLEQL